MKVIYLFGLFKKKSSANNEKQKRMSSEEIDRYGEELTSIISPDGFVSPDMHMVVSGFVYAKVVFNSQFLFSSNVAVADSLFFAAFINAKKSTELIHYDNLVKKYTNRIYSMTYTLFKEKYDPSDEFISELKSNRLFFYERIWNSKPSKEERINAVREEYELILMQDYSMRQYAPFSESSALTLLGINETMRCREEVQMFIARFDTLFSEDVERTNKYLRSTQDSWDEAKND